MNKWVRKFLVALFTIATFGLITPPAVLLAEENQSTKAHQSSDTQQESFEEIRNHDPVDLILGDAKEQAYEKFGGKIGPVIEGQFDSIIFPKIEEVVHAFLREEEHIKQVALSKKPSGGRGEKIFHLYDENTGKDLIRFHVRVDHPPKEGYWFNFHYHTYHDNFRTHHELGTIFWDYNTPPNWKTH